MKKQINNMLSDRQKISQHINESIRVKQQILKTLTEPIEQAAAYFFETLKNDGKILFCGNGGSAADAQHLAAEFVVRLRSSVNRPALPALALTVDTSVLTAAANDLGVEEIFSRQVEALGKSGDLLLAISTIGNSTNIIKAVEAAQQRNISVIGFLGGAGGMLLDKVDLPILVPSDTTARIQEVHILIGHILCELAEDKLFN